MLRLIADDGLGPLAHVVPDQYGERVGLEVAMADLDRQAHTWDGSRTHPKAVGFSWDDEDASDRRWWPQGLTTSADAAAVSSDVLPRQRRVLLTAWYAKEPEGSGAATRLSLVDLDAGRAGPRYAHVLLVIPQRDDVSGTIGARPITVHAGGLVWCGQHLLLADTRRGLRVFDLANLTRLDGRGHQWPGFRFVLPQSGWWRARAEGDTQPLRWSFASLDTTEPTALSLIAGEYARDGAAARLARFALDPDTGSLMAAGAVEVIRAGLTSMQGAVRVHGTYVVCSSRGRLHRGQMWTGRPGGGPWTRHPRALPVGPEDLSYDPGSGLLWIQTEYPGRRCVLNRPLPGGLTPAARR